jgi:long-chain acyl-CoA synthetase
MVRLQSESANRSQEIRPPPPPGKPYSVALPGSKVEGRTPVYRHWRFVDGLLESLDPQIRTAHEFFEDTASKVPKNRCLGKRPWDVKTKKWGDYIWEDYATVQTRRRDAGAGLVLLHEKYGVFGKQYGVGLWCQNRPEWQITGS